MKYILILFILLACSSKEVRKSDLNSWEGESTTALETHPVFSTLPRELREIPDSNRTLINFSQKKVETYRGNCVGVGYGFGPVGLGSGTCGPTRIEESDCTHQFLVENKRIISYEVLGKECFTDCKFRPKNKKCKD